MSEEKPQKPNKEHPFRRAQRKREEKVRRKLGSGQRPDLEITARDRDTFSRCSVRAAVWGTSAFVCTVVPQQVFFTPATATVSNKVLRAAGLGIVSFFLGATMSFPGCIVYVMNSGTPLGHHWKEREGKRVKWWIEKVLPDSVTKLIYNPPKD